MNDIRKMAVAGSWYPENAQELRALLAKMIDSVCDGEKSGGEIAGMVVPHAGFVYSGPVAASAYCQLKKGDYDVVLLLGTSHRYRFEHASVYDGTAVETPLGMLPIDSVGVSYLLENSDEIGAHSDLHEQEHTLEAHFPFIRYMLGKIPVIPVILANNDDVHVANITALLTQFLAQTEQRVLIIASTDLSHYHPYDEAIKLDRKSVDAIKTFDLLKLASCELCGLPSVRVFLELMRGKADKAVVVDERNSGDVRPESRKGGVVGYASLLFYENGDK